MFTQLIPADDDDDEDDDDGEVRALLLMFFMDPLWLFCLDVHVSDEPARVAACIELLAGLIVVCTALFLFIL